MGKYTSLSTFSSMKEAKFLLPNKHPQWRLKECIVQNIFLVAVSLCLNCIYYKLFSCVTKSLTQHDSTQAATGAWRLGTFATWDTMPHEVSPPIQSASSYKWLLMFSFNSPSPGPGLTSRRLEIKPDLHRSVCNVYTFIYHFKTYAIFNLPWLLVSDIWSDKWQQKFESSINNNLTTNLYFKSIEARANV